MAQQSIQKFSAYVNLVEVLIKDARLLGQFFVARAGGRGEGGERARHEHQSQEHRSEVRHCSLKNKNILLIFSDANRGSLSDSPREESWQKGTERTPL